MVAIFLWCGMMYPELIFTDDVFCILNEEGVEQKSGAVEAYYDFLNAEPKQIEYKSRILEFIENM